MPLLQVENLSQVARSTRSLGPRTYFAAVSFGVAAGEQVAVLGPRGAGKTQLARALALIERPAAGRVCFDGQDVTRAWGGRLRGLRRSLQFVGGDARRSLSPRLTIAQVLAEPLQVHHLGSAAQQQASVAAAADAWQLNPLWLELRANALSLALCQRVALARACLLQPRLLVCDELSERLEPASVAPLLALIGHFCRAAGMAWVWTTTDSGLAREFADRVLVVEEGTVKEREKAQEN